MGNISLNHYMLGMDLKIVQSKNIKSALRKANKIITLSNNFMRYSKLSDIDYRMLE